MTTFQGNRSTLQKWQINLLVFGIYGSAWSCRSLDQKPSQEYAVTQETTFVEQNLSPLEKNADRVFRDLFAWHMMKEGYSPGAVQQAVYLVPPAMHLVPVTQDPREFFQVMSERIASEKASDWYLHGIKDPPKPRIPRTPQKAATIVVIPGIFGEFIKNYPFHEIVTNKHSLFHQRWQPLLDGVQDEVFSLADLKPVPIPLGEVLKIGSYDIDGRSWVQVIVLEAKFGSLETLGTLESVMPVYKRRLNKLFSLIKDDSDVYVLGYSRGTPVALELIKQVSEKTDQHPWISRLKGLIGLGGVYYGTMVADDALSQSPGGNGTFLGILRRLVAELKVDEDAINGKNSKNSAIYMAHNTKAWTVALKNLTQLQIQAMNPGVERDKTKKEFSLEQKLRAQSGLIQRPDIFGLVELVQNFAFDLLKRECPMACYFKNVATFKLLMTRVFEGIESLTVQAGLAWWEQNSLPPSLRILSIVGSMPDATKDGPLTPLFENPNYGVNMVDFNRILRGSFYGVFGVEKTQMNDSQVTYARSRYWASAFANRGHKNYFLGVMGTHHWGFSFPFAIKNADQSINPYPRSALMAAIGSFIEEINFQEASAK